MREKWSAKLQAQASQARKENKPEAKTKNEIKLKQKKAHRKPKSKMQRSNV